MKSFDPKYYFLIVLLFLKIWLNAQSLYPVTASLRLSGPSSSRFFTFSQPGMIAGRPNRIALDLRLNDLDEPSLDVRLKWDIAGPDISFSSSDLSASNIVSLISGQFVQLDNAALSSYFQPSAFDGLSDDFLLRSDGLLPEGIYEVCVTAYELTQGKQVSNTSCQIIFLEELEPPLIVTPLDEVLPTYPQNVILNWQANHLAVFPVQYTIALWEEIDGLSPDQITFQTPPLYTETVQNRTAFVFNASHPLLTPGKHYLAQVRARDNDDAYVFKNNGFSPIHRFYYGSSADDGICEAPSVGEYGFSFGNLLHLSWNGGDIAGAIAAAENKASGGDAQSAPILGSRSSSTSSLSVANDFGEVIKKATGFFRIRYRILGTEEWSSFDTDQLTAGLRGLRAGKTYEIEISKVCASGIITAPIFTVDIPKIPRRRPLECGSEMSENELDQTPIDELVVDDTIIAAGAYVRLTNVVGGPSGWSGEGEVALPFLPKSRVLVEFNNIVVNTSYELITGYLETVYDDKMTNVVNLDGISGMFDKGPSIEQINYSIPIDTIMQGPGGIIIVKRSDGGIDSFKAPIIVIAPGLEAVLVNGYQFEVFDMDDMVDSIAPEQFTFMAHPEQKYGFDGVNEAIKSEYKEEAGIVMPYKSVAFGEADKISAILTGGDPPADTSVHFVELSTAADLKFTRSGNEYEIVVGGLSSGLTQVIALGPNGIMGMFQVMGTAKEFVTVHLVPLNGYGKNADAKAIEEAATKILRQAGFSVRIDVLDVGLQYDGAKIGLENHFASAYSPDMKQIISQLGRKVNKETNDVYMILTDKMEGNTTGFMPKGMGIGFMELGGGGQTLAHELCHGLFNMPHTFEGFYEGQGKGALADNLMDYVGGTALYYRQWARMQSPGVHLAWFDDAGEGKYAEVSDIEALKKSFAEENGEILTFLKPNGRPISLKSKDLSAVTFATGENYVSENILEIPLGSLTFFTYGGKSYQINANSSIVESVNNQLFVDSLSKGRTHGVAAFLCFEQGAFTLNAYTLPIIPSQDLLHIDGIYKQILGNPSANPTPISASVVISDEARDYLNSLDGKTNCSNPLSPYYIINAIHLTSFPGIWDLCAPKDFSDYPFIFKYEEVVPQTTSYEEIASLITAARTKYVDYKKKKEQELLLLSGQLLNESNPQLLESRLDEVIQLGNDCLLRLLNFETRIHILKTLFNNSIDRKDIFNSLLETTLDIVERKAMLELMHTQKLLGKGVDFLSGADEDGFYNTLNVWVKEIYATQDYSFACKQFSFDSQGNLELGDNCIVWRADKEPNKVIEYDQASNQFFLRDKIKGTFSTKRPTDFVEIYYTTHFSGSVEEGSIALVSVVDAYKKSLDRLFEQQMDAIRVGIEAVSIVTTIATMGSGSVALPIFEIALSAADMTVTVNKGNIIAAYGSEGTSFIDTWDQVAVLVGAGIIAKTGVKYITKRGPAFFSSMPPDAYNTSKKSVEDAITSLKSMLTKVKSSDLDAISIINQQIKVLQENTLAMLAKIKSELNSNYALSVKNLDELFVHNSGKSILIGKIASDGEGRLLLTGAKVDTDIPVGFQKSGKLTARLDEVDEELEIWVKGDLVVLRKGVTEAGSVNSLDDFLALILPQKLDNIAKGWTAYYPQIFFERRLFEDMMGHYRYLKSSGWGHTNDIAHNFKAIDFYQDFTKVEDDIFAETVVSMKTTTTTNVDNWLASNPVKSNLDNLIAGKGASNGIEWSGTKIYYNNAEVHIYMPQANITPQLKTEWLKKLAIEEPEISFKINALEDFIQ